MSFYRFTDMGWEALPETLETLETVKRLNG